MKRKLCLGILLVMLIGLLGVFPAMAAADVSWAEVTYTYDPDTEGGEQKSGLISFTAGSETYLERYTTLTWNAQTTILYLDGAPQSGGETRVEQAGRYHLTVVDTGSGDRKDCSFTMLPVIKADGEYFSFDSATKSMYEHTFTRYPVIECENVGSISFDLGMSTAIKNFQSGTRVTSMGRHTLKITSRGAGFDVTFNVAACTAQKTFDAELGLNCLVINVGEFYLDAETPADVSVLLDGTTLLQPGINKITKPGQHTLLATTNGEVISALNAMPTTASLNLQLELLLPTGTDVEDAITLRFSLWDAVFYVDGELIEGDYRLTDSGEHVFVAKTKNADGSETVIQDVFLVRKVASEPGTSYTELVLDFHNPHHFYVIFLIIPAVLMIAAAVFFFLQRRRIV